MDLRERIEHELATLDGLLPGESMFGHGRAYWANGTEVLHFENPSTVEVRLTRGVIRDNRAAPRRDARVTLRPHGGDWITIRIAAPADVELVTELARRAADAHRPPRGVLAKPPPDGAELARRKRFH